MGKNINPNTIKQNGLLRRWWFWLGIILLLSAIGLTGVWRYFASAAYFQRHVRPDLEALLGGRPVLVGTYEFAPLSGIHLKDVEVGALPGETDKTPVLTIKEMDVRYNALAMRNNRIVASKVLIDSLTAHIRQMPDGSLEGPFPTLIQEADKTKPTTNTATSTEKPIKKVKVNSKNKGLQYDIQNVEVRNVNIQFDQYGKDAKPPQKFALENFSLTCAQFSLTKPFQIDLKGKLRTNELTADISFNPKATLQNARIHLDPSPLKLEESGKPLLHVDVGMDVDPTTQSGNATLKIFPADKRFLNLAAAATGIDFRDTVLAGDLQIALEKGEPSDIKGLLNATQCNPIGAGIPESLPVTDLQLAINATLGNESAQITSCTLQAKTADQAKNLLLNLGVSGPIRWGKKAGAQLQVHAPQLQLQPFLHLLKIQPATDAPAFLIQNLHAQMAFDPNRFELNGLTAEVAGGKIAVKNFQAQPSSSAPALLRWKGLEAQDIDMDTLLANVSAKHHGQLTGKAHLISSGSARGLSEQDMREALRGSLNASITDGELKNIPLLDELASATGIADLRKMPFSKFDSEFIAGDKNIEIKRCFLIGQEQKAEASGVCEYDTTLKAPLTLALGGKLREFAQREKIAKAFKSDADGYLAFPLPLMITGKLAKPKIKLNLPKEELIQTATDVLQQLDKKGKRDKDADKKTINNLLDTLKKKK